MSTTAGIKRKHRFQLPSNRLKAIKLTPFAFDKSDRKLHQDVDENQSHFRCALEAYDERNLSEAYTTLSRKLRPLCTNPALVLHNRKEIFDLLDASIREANIHSIQPTLSLLVWLADDLASQYYQEFFKSAVDIIGDVVSSVENVDAIEACFEALTALLRRFLVPLQHDFTTLLQQLAPLLGKSRQKPHVRKLTAEAFSLVIRRCAKLEATRSGKPLHQLILQAFIELNATPRNQQEDFKDNLSHMILNAVKTTAKGLREDSTVMVDALLRVYFDDADGEDEQSENTLNSQFLASPEPIHQLQRATVEDILIGIVCYADVSNARPVFKNIFDYVACISSAGDPVHISRASRLLIIACGTTRISELSSAIEWREVISTLSQITQTMRNVKEGATSDIVLQALSIVMHQAPTSVTRTSGQELTDTIMNNVSSKRFVQFCAYMNALGANEQLFENAFTEFAKMQWDQCEQEILIFIPNLSQSNRQTLADLVCDMTCSNNCADVRRLLPGDKMNDIDLVSHIDSRFKILNESTILSHTATQSLTRALHRLAKSVQGLVSNHASEDPAVHFAKSRALSFLAKHILVTPQNEIIELIISSASTHATSTCYLDALHSITQSSYVSQVVEKATDEFYVQLAMSLTSSHKDVRAKTLTIWHILSAHFDGCELMTAVIDIEKMAFEFSNIRSITLQFEKIGRILSSLQWHPRIGCAVAAYCLGMQHVPLASVWGDACNLLQSLCKIQSEAKEFAINVIMEWIKQEPSVVDNSPETTKHDTSQSKFYGVRYFPSSLKDRSLSLLREKAQESWTSIANAESQLRAQFESFNYPKPLNASSNRMVALRVLEKLPFLVQEQLDEFEIIIHDWLTIAPETALGMNRSDHDSEQGTSTKFAEPQRASRNDQKSILRITKGLGNLKSMWSDRTIKCIMDLLCDRDQELQRTALQTLFVCGNSSLKQYEQNLENLLDKNRLRDELTNLLSESTSDQILQPEHRSAVMEILVRILFGRSMAKSENTTANRKTIVGCLARFHALESFVDMALGPLAGIQHVSNVRSGQLNDGEVDRLVSSVPERRQVGILGMIELLIPAVSGPGFSLVPGQLLEAILSMLIHSFRHHTSMAPKQDGQDVEYKSIGNDVRRAGLKCLAIYFDKFPIENWSECIQVTCSEVLVRKAMRMDQENTEGISSFLKILAAWSCGELSLHELLQPHYKIWDGLIATLSNPLTKEDVKVFIVTDIIAHVVQNAQDSDLFGTIDVERSTDAKCETAAHKLSDALIKILNASSSRALLSVIPNVVNHLCRRVGTVAGVKTDFRTMIPIFLSLLDPSKKYVNHELRSMLLDALEKHMVWSKATMDEQLSDRTHDVLSSLFEYFLDHPSRQLLGKVFTKFNRGHGEDLERSAMLCQKLNETEGSHLGNTGNDSQQEVLKQIIDGPALTARAWQPLVYNFLFFIRNDSTLSSSRSAASDGLEQFISTVHEARHDGSTFNDDLKSTRLIQNTILPRIQKGLRAESELVARENLLLLGRMIQIGCDEVRSLKPLQASKFCANAFAVQQSSRMAAWDELASQAPLLDHTVLSKYFIPLSRTIIAKAAGKDQNVVDKIIQSLSQLIECVTYNEYHKLITRIALDEERLRNKIYTRELKAVVDALYRAHLSSNDDDGNKSNLARTLPDPASLPPAHTKVTSQLLRFLHLQDESTVDRRAYVAIVTSKLIATFPNDAKSAMLPNVMRYVCRMLRSKAQEARDDARKALSQILTIVGPQYLDYVVNELTSILNKGAYVHVLGYTVYSLLQSLLPDVAELDSKSVENICGIFIKDRFGDIRQEKDDPNYKSTWKEVKDNKKSLSGFKLVASVVSPTQLTYLTNVLHDELIRKQSQASKLDEVYVQVLNGLSENKRYRGEQGVRFCRQILSSQRPRDAFLAYSLLRMILNRNNGAIDTEILETFVPEISNTLTSKNGQCIVAASKVFIPLLKHHNLDIIDREAQRLSEIAGGILDEEFSLDSSAAQAALTILTGIIRERPQAAIGKQAFENLVTSVLSQLQPMFRSPKDIDGQGNIHLALSFLKSVLSRGYVINEVYTVRCFVSSLGPVTIV